MRHDIRSLTRFARAALPGALLALASSSGQAQSCSDDGHCATDEVCIEGMCALQGERNPLGLDYQGRYARRDEELLFSSSAQAGRLELGLAYDEVVELRTFPDALADGIGGRFVGVSTEQLVLLSETGPPGSYELRLIDPIGLDLKGGIHLDAPIVATHTISDANPLTRIALAAGDVDDLPEPYPSPGRDELVFVYQEDTGSEQPARLVVLGFAGVELPPGDLPVAPTSVASILLATDVNDTHPNTLQVDVGDLDGDGKRDIAVAFWNPSNGRVVVECFEVTSDPQGQLAIEPLMLDVGNGPELVPALVSDITASELGFGMATGRFDRRMETVTAPREQIAIAGRKNGKLRVEAWSLWPNGTPAPDWVNGIEGNETARTFDSLGTHGPSGDDLQPIASLDARVHVARAEFPVDPADDGLYGLDRIAVGVDTNYGPIVHVVAFNGTDTFSLSTGFPYSDECCPEPVWPSQSELNGRSATSAPSDLQLCAGNFIQKRSELVPASSGRNRANVCVAWPGGGVPLTAISFLVSGPWLHSVIVDADGAAIGGPLDFMVPADVDGDSAILASVDQDGNEVLLGAPVAHLHAETSIPESTLQEPPKHVDYLQAEGGIVNVSQTDGFFVKYSNSTTGTSQFDKTHKTDYAVGSSEKLSAMESVGLAVPSVGGASVTATQAESLAQTHDNSTAYYNGQTNQITLTQISTTERDDQVAVKAMDIDVWRYPLMGLEQVDGNGLPLPDSEQSAAPLFEIHVPRPGVTVYSGGRLVDDYQPYHINGNILSYPLFDANGYIPPDVGFFEVVDTDGAIHEFDDPLWAENAYGVGGGSNSYTLNVQQTTANSAMLSSKDKWTETSDWTVGGKVNATGGYFSAGVEVKYEHTSTESETFSRSRLSKNTTTVNTAITLQVPATIPSQRGYGIYPAWHFTKAGGMRVAHAVDPRFSSQVTWWDDNYDAPDPALNLPYRITADLGGTWELNTDPSRQRAKGVLFFHADGQPLVAAPGEGEVVRIDARVYNLSLGTAARDVLVRFHAVEVNPSGAVIANNPIGETVIDCIPTHDGVTDSCSSAPPLAGGPANMRVASVMWDTRGFGPPSGMGTRTWRIWVTIDPRNTIANETHELKDRYNDPLLGPDGQPVDLLEKGQNNTGWATISVAKPALGITATPSTVRPDFWMTPSSLRVLPRRAGGAPFAASAGDEIALGVRLHSAVDDPTVRTLLVRATGPDGATEVVVRRRVWGVSSGAGTLVTLEWTPPAPGQYVLVADMEEPFGDSNPGNAVDTLRIDVR